jgi:hypothetical protein
MARTGIVHHIGTFLLFSASILFLITTISAPVVNDIGILKVTLTNRTHGHQSVVTFGTFGYCILDAGSNDIDYCTPKHIGYDPTAIMAAIDDTSFNTASKDTTKALTRVMVLHPIVTGVAFIAFLIALGSGMCGSLFAAFIAAVTFLIALIVMATDFALFVIVRNHVNNDGSGSHANFSTGMWTMLVGTIALFFAFFFVLFSCCSARMHKQRGTSKESGYVDGVAPATRRGRFWPSRTRY